MSRTRAASIGKEEDPIQGVLRKHSWLDLVTDTCGDEREVRGFYPGHLVLVTRRAV